jgi:hypothetical protein
MRMNRAIRLRILGSLAVAAALALPAGSAMAAAPTAAPAYTCSGGDFASGDFTSIPSGTYASITVTGVCDVVPYAVINVVGNINVEAGAVLDAQTVPSTINVGHNVTAATGSLLGLGCQPDTHVRTGHECGAQFDPDDQGPPGTDPVDANGDDVDDPGVNPFANDSSAITVNGNVTAHGANTVLLNGITVKRNVTLTGGGGDIPWSVKNDMIAGNLTVSGVTADWFGALFNRIGKNATLTNITATDPGDPGRKIFVVRNTIGRNLTCMGLAPGVSGGFFPGEVNTVGRNAIGQCAPLV